MSGPPPGISEAQWVQARKLACEAELKRLAKVGGFCPHQIKEAFAKGWCDTSGKVADFL